MASAIFKKNIIVMATRKYSSGFVNKIDPSINVVKSPFKDVEIANCPIADHVWKNLTKWAERTAIICGATKRSYTYYQLYTKSRNVAANLLTRLGLSKGDTVQITLHNCPEFPILALGVLQAGCVLSTMSPVFTHGEVRKNLLLSKPKLIIGSSVTMPVIEVALKFNNSKVPIINININENSSFETSSWFHELTQNADCDVLNKVHMNADDVSVMPFSSGTTSLPKGVELTARNLVTNYMQQDIDEIKHYNDTTGSYQESVMAVIPFCHIYGLSLIMLHKLSVGAKLVCLPRFRPDTFLDTLKEHKVSLVYAAPPIVFFLSSLDGVKQKNLDSVNKIVNGAAPVLKINVDKMLEKLKPNSQFIQVYGSTEASLVTSTVREDKYSETTDTCLSSGYALPNTEMKIVDENYWTLGRNEVGELLIRGPQIMKGYRNNGDATKECFTSDGWFRSGDLAKINENGCVHIVDRMKELIKVKGYQVPPVEIENVLRGHPAVVDAGVVGKPDRRRGEVPKAFVVLKEEYRTTKEDLMEFVRQRVSEYKTVRDIEFVRDLPKSSSGKLLRRVLKDYCK